MSSKEEKLLKWSSLIATVATAILAITALITVIVTLKAWKVEREAARPYLTFKESPTVDVDVREGINMEFKFYNVGTHPAVNLSSRSVVFEASLSRPPVHNYNYELVNEIPKDTSSSLVITLGNQDINSGQPNIGPYYVVVALKYQDPLINKVYNQNIFLKWTGVKDGQPQGLVHVQAKEKENIVAYLKKNNIIMP